MRLTIANKLFIGFLCVILLNAAYLVVVNKLGRITAAVSLLQRQNDVRNRLTMLKSLQRNREEAAFRFEKTAQKEWSVLLHDYTRVGATLLDSIRGQSDSVVRCETRLQKPGAFGKTLVAPEKMADLVRSIDSADIAYAALFDRLLRLRDPGCSFKWSFSEPMLIDALDSSAAVLDARTDSAAAIAGASSNDRIARIGGEISRVKEATVAGLLFLTVFSILFGLIFSRTITTSLRRLKEAAGNVGKADFNVNPEGYPDDETGDLAAAFFDMAVNLRKNQEDLVKSKRLAAIGEIVASVNHEINNPLMIISGNAQFLEMTMAEYPLAMKERVRAILQETDRIAKITRKLREIRNPVAGEYGSGDRGMIDLDKSS